jgi:hypothetical protein
MLPMPRRAEQRAEAFSVGDAMVAAALIDRLAHDDSMSPLKGKSYRLRKRAAISDKPPVGPATGTLMTERGEPRRRRRLAPTNWRTL